tara:strand:- start:895 stop:1380 length:486 start_codon:yes stop_codon:yes gene_type:complete
MGNFKIALSVFLVLIVSRVIPHPPNFTTLLALSFYVPAILGIRFIPVVVVSFLITDLYFGFHSVILFTWGSVIIIGYISKYFNRSLLYRIMGSLSGAVIFYLVTNFGVWATGSYGYDIAGLSQSYIMAIPFFTYSIISTFIFSTIIESLYFVYKLKLKKID